MELGEELLKKWEEIGKHRQAITDLTQNLSAEQRKEIGGYIYK